MIYAFSNRYFVSPAGGNSYPSSYVIDSWTGQSWLLIGEEYFPVKSNKKGNSSTSKKNNSPLFED